MYHTIVRRKLHATFAHVNKRNYAAVVDGMAKDDVEHWFSGTHALGNGRDSIQDIQRWYDRLAVVLPDLRFEIKKTLVNGWPWNTSAVVEWVDHVSDRAGTRYSNQGVHVLTIKWGKVTEMHIYCDTQKLAGILETIGDQGVEEAVGAPIGGAEPFAKQA
jgi:ketosteroid isomerase-like protein